MNSILILLFAAPYFGQNIVHFQLIIHKRTFKKLDFEIIINYYY